MRREIGRGSIGVVALGRWRETDVAIKILEGPPDESARDKRRDVDPALRRAMQKEVCHFKTAIGALPAASPLPIFFPNKRHSSLGCVMGMSCALLYYANYVV